MNGCDQEGYDVLIVELRLLAAIKHWSGTMTVEGHNGKVRRWEHITVGDKAGNLRKKKC